MAVCLLGAFCTYTQRNQQRLRGMAKQAVAIDD